jgi:hypothetical protein
MKASIETMPSPDLLLRLRTAIANFDAAADGPSLDAEHHAAVQVRDTAEAVVTAMAALHAKS